MRKVVIGCIVLIFLAFSFVLYQNNQPPKASDVIKSTQDWTSQPNDVLTIEAIDGEWITFFRNSEAMYVGFLQQNWLGQWSLGNEGAIGEVSFDPNSEARNGLVWGASGLSKGSEQLFSYYYGMVSNSEIDKITLSIGNKEPENVSFIEGDGERFFFVKKESENTVPFEFKAFSDGEVIFQGN